jgi:23S rRNA pseudouridine1911/1915/1917 synthase
MAGDPFRTFHLAAEHDGQTLAAAMKRLLTPTRSVSEGLSWSQVRKLIAGRRVQVNGNLCLDEERKVKAGDVVRLWNRALAAPPDADDVKLVYVDEHLVVIQKPAGVTTLRHREATDLPQRRKQLQPTLDELVPQLLARHLGLHDAGGRGSRRAAQRRGPRTDPRLTIYPVHRLDRDTSGLMLFARTRQAEQKLIHMFARHDVQRAYVAVVHGRIAAPLTIDSWIVRDRGDGLRGSAPQGESSEGARRAVTHVRPMEEINGYTVVECRLETGRTHQIRIHLAELGHPLCGEKTYTHRIGQPPENDDSRAPRQALHAAGLSLQHPLTGQLLRFRMPLPDDLKQWLLALRQAGRV